MHQPNTFNRMPLEAYGAQNGMRSKSNNVEMRYSNKEEFKLRMDNKVNNLIKQGNMVEGFVKLHTVF